MLEQLTNHLAQANTLSDEQVSMAVTALTDETVGAEKKAAFLVALANKGETTEEIAAFPRELRGRSIAPPLDVKTRQREILDVCGTGGDRLNTFNISTAVALVAAAAGVTVAKHGNRAITSQAGSADVLEALGVRIDFTPQEAVDSLRERGFAFFFAPKYHPAFKHIGPARKLCAERGQRTIFNFLGPLLNPARPSAQLVGVPRPQLCEPIARVLQMLGVRRAMVVSGQVRSHEAQAGTSTAQPNDAQSSFLDELSTLGDNTIAEFYQDRAFAVSTFASEGFGFQRGSLSDLAGGDRETNARIVLAVLEGKDRGPKRDAVLFNAGAALFVAGRARSQMDGFAQAGELIDNGVALAKLRQLQQ